MEFPFGHHNHHHRSHHRRDDDGEDEFPPPGRRPYDGPPPPEVTHVYHSSHEGGPPPPNYGRPHFPPPPSYVEGSFGRPDYPRPPPMVEEDNYGGGSYNRPPPPPPAYHEGPDYSSVHHVSHESENAPRHHGGGFEPCNYGNPVLMDKPSFRVYTKADTNYSLSVRDDKVILAISNPSDPFQHWFKDETFSTKVKDEYGSPSFALVNKAAGLAIKHSIGPSHPVQLIPYDPSVLDASVLWTESKEVSDGYRAIRMVNNTRLNLDAWNADKEHGGVRDGTIVALWEWWKGDNKNQQWKIVPY